MIKSKTSLYIGLVLIATFCIFLILPYKGTKSEKAETGVQKTFNFEDYHSKFLDNLGDKDKEEIASLESQFYDNDDTIRNRAFSKAISKYNELDEPLLAAWTVYKKAKVINHSHSWEITGDNFEKLLSTNRYDSTIAKSIAQLTIESYENGYNQDTTNTSARLKMARAYIELENQPMKGVQQLLAVVREDENNVDAQLMLAKFGLISGQYEKVGQRLEKVLSLHPQNIDALLMRADMNSVLGKTDKSIADLEKVKNQNSIPQEMKIQLEKAIEELKMKK